MHLRRFSLLPEPKIARRELNLEVSDAVERVEDLGGRILRTGLGQVGLGRDEVLERFEDGFKEGDEENRACVGMMQLMVGLCESVWGQRVWDRLTQSTVGVRRGPLCFHFYV